MSNVKLVDDLWASEGVFDVTQSNAQTVLNPKLVYRNHATASTIASLIGDLYAYMNNNGNGAYFFVGAWTQHSYGYNAFCMRYDYDTSQGVYGYAGLVISYDGNVWTFITRTGATNVIRKVTVTTA